MTAGSHSRQSQIESYGKPYFRFSFYEIYVQNQCGHNILRCQLRALTLAVRIQLQLGGNTYFFSFALMNLQGKPMRRTRRQKELLCFFVGASLYIRKSYLGPAEIMSFSSRDFSLSNNHYTFRHVYRLDTFTFYFAEPLLLQIFFSWKFIKTQDFLCLLPLLRSTATQITISTNMFLSFKYYTV